MIYMILKSRVILIELKHNKPFDCLFKVPTSTSIQIKVQKNKKSSKRESRKSEEGMPLSFGFDLQIHIGQNLVLLELMIGDGDNEFNFCNNF